MRRFCFWWLCRNQNCGLVPCWAQVAEAGYGGGNEGEGAVDLFGGGEAGEGEADAGAGAGGGEAHGGEDVGGLGGAGLAGGASADGEALEVEGDDQGFGVDVIEVEVGGVGDARGAGAVDAGVGDCSEEALFEAVAEGGEVCWDRCGVGLSQPCVGEFGGFAEGYDAGDVFGAGAALALVGAAVEERGEADVAADEEDAGALRGVHLVAGDGEQVDVLERGLGAEVEGELAGGLDGVGVEESAGGVGDGGEFGDGLDDAGLVVGEHDGDEPRVGAEGGCEGGGLDEAVRGAGRGR